jgi:hypothetical protein
MFNRGPQPLPEIFAKYAGVQIPHEEYEQEFAGGIKHKFQRPTEEGEALLKEIYQVAADNNVNLRLWTPAVMGTMDVVLSRLNIKTDANWVIRDKCTYG